MPRSTMDPEPYRQFIESFYNHETIYYSVEDIVAELHTSHDVKVSVRTLARWLQMWEPKRYTRTDDTPELRIRIITLFFDSGLNDKLMLKILKKDSYSKQTAADTHRSWIGKTYIQGSCGSVDRCALINC